MKPHVVAATVSSTFVIGAVLWVSVAQADATLSAWWSRAIDGGDHGVPASFIAWHARLMVLAWSLLIPVGIVVARFYKVTPAQRFPERLDNQFWWFTHQVMQYSGVLLTLAAIYLVTGRDSASTSTTGYVHGVAGWTLCGLCIIQVVGAWLRGSKGGPVDVNAWPDSPVLAGDHYNRTRRRIIFEHIHITLGYATLALAIITTMLGLYASAAPRWMWAVLLIWWALVAARYLQLQRRNTHVRTYQAIWGHARNHPGNQI